jgi:nicotinamide phosphoribosyltransferase
MKTNIILDTDSYKSSHFLQFPEGTDYMTSYIESRGGRFDETLFFGLQYILKEYLSKPISLEMVEEAKTFMEKHGVPFPYNDWKYIATELNGKLPIEIRSVAEGTIVPTHNVLFTVESTDPRVFWIVGWFETLLMRMWYPVTVATQSYQIKKLIFKFLQETSDEPDQEIAFKLHDFGSRGVSTLEQAMLGGASHLVNFMGSDTVAGIRMANEYYYCDMSAFSIPAAEHSTITSWGRENESKAYQNMITQFSKPGSIYACVSDSYDIFNACEKIWGEELKEQVIKSGGTLVVRPDSGIPWEIVLQVMDILAAKFGTTTNTKGYKVLQHVRVIQGDGVEYTSIERILNVLKDKGYSATNIAFGMGGALLQKIDRDTQKFAYKCSGVKVHGKFRPVSKDPITDKEKKSKEGILELIKRDGNFLTIKREEIKTTDTLCLETVFKNGDIVKIYTLDDIRQRARL